MKVLLVRHVSRMLCHVRCYTFPGYTESDSIYTRLSNNELKPLVRFAQCSSVLEMVNEMKNNSRDKSKQMKMNFKSTRFEWKSERASPTHHNPNMNDRIMLLILQSISTSIQNKHYTRWMAMKSIIKQLITHQKLFSLHFRLQNTRRNGENEEYIEQC